MRGGRVGSGVRAGQGDPTVPEGLAAQRPSGSEAVRTLGLSSLSFPCAPTCPVISLTGTSLGETTQERIWEYGFSS